MESELIKTATQWGPFAGLLLLTLYGAYRLVMYVLTTSASREDKLMVHQQTIEPRLACIEQKTDAAIAITTRTEAKVNKVVEQLAAKQKE